MAASMSGRRRPYSDAVEDFAAQVEDVTRGMAVAVETGAPALVAFGGLQGRLIIPPFEFFSMAQRLGTTTRVFLRDPSQSWYSGGVPELGGSFRAAADGLAGLLRSAKAARTVFVGTSAGGFAALGMGALADADVVHAFSPQTTMRARHRRRMADERWPEQSARLSRRDRDLDLRRLLKRRTRAGLHVHVAEDDRLDLAHAERLEGLPGVQVHRYVTGGHLLARHLRDTGALEELVRGALHP